MREICNTPLLFLIFNRPNTTAQVFEAIAKARPRRLFVAADGPRTDKEGEAEKCQAVREIIKRVDWDCEVKALFREQNLGCKEAVSSAITWFFEQVEDGIILEDDCLPSDSFFSFCGELLEKYRDDERVMMISGDNFQDGIQRGNDSYYFSMIPHIWGWATWRRAWKLYDKEMKTLPAFVSDKTFRCFSPDVDIQNFWLSNFIPTYKGLIGTWDYQWVYAILSFGGLSICPQVNMISNIGFGESACNTTDKGSRFANMARGDIRRITHPVAVQIDLQADAYTYRVVYDVGCHSKKGISRWRRLARKRREAFLEVRNFCRKMK